MGSSSSPSSSPLPSESLSGAPNGFAGFELWKGDGEAPGAPKLLSGLLPDSAEPKELPPRLPPKPLEPLERLANGDAPPALPNVSFGAAADACGAEAAGGDAKDANLGVPEPKGLLVEEPIEPKGDAAVASLLNPEAAKALADVGASFLTGDFPASSAVSVVFSVVFSAGS